MALMLLPFWTDGCIGSMEGLYFEASATTPYHFLDAAALSRARSNPVRRLHVRERRRGRGRRSTCRPLGVRYYLGLQPDGRCSRPTRTRPQAGRDRPVRGRLRGGAAPTSWCPLKPRSPSCRRVSSSRRRRGSNSARSTSRHPDAVAGGARGTSGPADWKRITVKRTSKDTPIAGTSPSSHPTARTRPVTYPDVTGQRREDRRRSDLVHGRQDRRAHAREGDVLPELEGRGRREVRAGWRRTSWS